MSVSSTLLAIVAWPFRQLRAAGANLRSGVAALNLRDVIAPWLIARYKSLKAFFGEKVAWSLGDGSPVEMMVGSLISAIALVVVSFTLLTYVAVVFVVPFLIGFIRLWPWANGLWTAYWPLYGALGWGSQ